MWWYMELQTDLSCSRASSSSIWTPTSNGSVTSSSTSTTVTLRLCGLQPLFGRQLVRHSRIPDFFPNNTAHDFVYFGGSSFDLNTLWLVGGDGGILRLRRVGLRLGERDCVDGGVLVKFTVCYFFGECQDSASVPVMGSVVVVVSEGGCGRYLRDRSSCKKPGKCSLARELGKLERLVDACVWPTCGTLCHSTVEDHR